MSQPQTKRLTPCAGRCSTVFGDYVCRGCRRFNHEVIDWNTYSTEQQISIWQRLDYQLDQILPAMVAQADLSQVEEFLKSKRVRLMPNASVGRKYYHALRLCEKTPKFCEISGLGVDEQHVKALWVEFEKRILALAMANYEMAWLRATSLREFMQQIEQSKHDALDE
ncbi:MAG: DUF1289 domain-containing protein [Acinetobacter sp.]|nr:DUF1289 domain-containing protein [Acinetobacter sp.]